jgi:hypothetical protein
VTGPGRDWWLDVGAWTHMAGCAHCGWRTVVGSVELARDKAEDHLVSAHSGDVRRRAADARARRRREVAGDGER